MYADNVERGVGTAREVRRGKVESLIKKAEKDPYAYIRIDANTCRPSELAAFLEKVETASIDMKEATDAQRAAVVRVPGSLIDRGGDGTRRGIVHYPNLVSVEMSMQLTSCSSLDMPNLREVGARLPKEGRGETAINAPHLAHLELPSLERVEGDIYLGDEALTIRLPKLRELSGALEAKNATRVNFSSLERVGQLEFYHLKLEGLEGDFASLETVTGRLLLQSLEEVRLPKLKEVNHLFCSDPRILEVPVLERAVALTMSSQLNTLEKLVLNEQGRMQIGSIGYKTVVVKLDTARTFTAQDEAGSVVPQELFSLKEYFVSLKEKGVLNKDCILRD